MMRDAWAVRFGAEADEMMAAMDADRRQDGRRRIGPTQAVELFWRLGAAEILEPVHHERWRIVRAVDVGVGLSIGHGRLIAEPACGRGVLLR